MKSVWFITNPASGSTSQAKCDAIQAVFAERGLTLAGRTAFPADDLPEPAALDAAGVDTAILFAGDGTVNAAVSRLAAWRGKILILPGGTMNLLAKALHGDADASAIVHAAHRGGETVALPVVAAGPHRGLVGVILGPAASWVRARELVRAGRLRGLLRAMRHAWAKTFTRGIRLEDVPALRHRQQAIFVMPDNGNLDLRGIDARAWRSIVALGWDWLTGDWIASPAVTQVHVAALRVAGRKPTLALFDGEPVMLAPGVTITGGMTAKMFIRTKGKSA
ncbi:diacylglycerol/lipid kinase family protein [Sphingomonas hylomeconis]|uniref:Diacylglycerol/lipid kinase family protein n=1 Tax=Sphingomonas hylomeconis TaxID=1395958 RepID=A0ABV7SW32_9SPHN|nr:diacylglycerol kinase family protein [Sphingomonas hylomeconis]